MLVETIKGLNSKLVIIETLNGIENLSDEKINSLEKLFKTHLKVIEVNFNQTNSMKRKTEKMKKNEDN